MNVFDRDVLINYTLGRLSPDDAKALEEQARTDVELASVLETLRNELNVVDAPRRTSNPFRRLFSNRSSDVKNSAASVSAPESVADDKTKSNDNDNVNDNRDGGSSAKNKSIDKYSGERNAVVASPLSSSISDERRRNKRFAFIPKRVEAPRTLDSSGLVFKRASLNVPKKETKRTSQASPLVHDELRPLLARLQESYYLKDSIADVDLAYSTRARALRSPLFFESSSPTLEHGTRFVVGGLSKRNRSSLAVDVPEIDAGERRRYAVVETHDADKNETWTFCRGEVSQNFSLGKQEASAGQANLLPNFDSAVYRLTPFEFVPASTSPAVVPVVEQKESVLAADVSGVAEVPSEARETESVEPAVVGTSKFVEIAEVSEEPNVSSVTETTETPEVSGFAQVPTVAAVVEESEVAEEVEPVAIVEESEVAEEVEPAVVVASEETNVPEIPEITEYEPTDKFIASSVEETSEEAESASTSELILAVEADELQNYSIVRLDEPLDQALEEQAEERDAETPLEEIQTESSPEESNAFVDEEALEETAFVPTTSFVNYSVETEQEEDEIGPTLSAEDRQLAELLGREPTAIDLSEYYWEDYDENAENNENRDSSSNILSRLVHSAFMAATAPPVLVGRATIGLYRKLAPTGIAHSEDFEDPSHSSKRRKVSKSRISDMMLSMIIGMSIAVFVVFPALRLVVHEVFVAVAKSRVRQIGGNVTLSPQNSDEDLVPFITEQFLFPQYETVEFNYPQNENASDGEGTPSGTLETDRQEEAPSFDDDAPFINYEHEP